MIDKSRHEPDDEPTRKQDRRRLPPEIAQPFPPEVGQALNHWLRRRILRALIADDVPLSPADLARGRLVDEHLSNVSYHMNVLAAAGLVRQVGARQVRGTVQHFYVADIADKPLVVQALKQTERLDRVDEAGGR